MNVKKGLIAGVSALMLLGGAYGASSAYAASNNTSSTSAPVTAKAHAGHLGKKLTVLEHYKTQIHQVNLLQEQRLELQKQILVKRDKLMDLVIAAKQNGNKAKLKQAKDVKKQMNELKKEMKSLLKTQRTDVKALKEALENGSNANAQYQELISTGKKVNEKMIQMSADLDKLITILK